MKFKEKLIFIECKIKSLLRYSIKIKYNSIKIFAIIIAIILLCPIIFLNNNYLFSEETTDVVKNDSNSHKVDFYQEKISINCFHEHVEIEGTYFLENLTKANLSITFNYPFPMDDHHPFPYDIEVENHNFWKDSSSAYFNLSMLPNEKKSIIVRYKQRHYNKQITYILTTTQYWGRAIQKADFIITTPLDWKNVNISLKPDKEKMIKDKKVIYITKNDFLPNKDLIIKWQ
ncbi:hypothetical protein H8E88_13900 [candidate division KSB1 bacterium]|nr:hypothetical protein [candidate division KSB1 bacterium]MBL7093802.1 hypothetical protein [candidate division KSB1 bacterium]